MTPLALLTDLPADNPFSDVARVLVYLAVGKLVGCFIIVLVSISVIVYVVRSTRRQDRILTLAENVLGLGKERKERAVEREQTASHLAEKIVGVVKETAESIKEVVPDKVVQKLDEQKAGESGFGTFLTTKPNDESKPKGCS